MRPPCSGSVASTSAAATIPPLHHRQRRRPAAATTHHRRCDSSALGPLSRSLHISAISGDNNLSPRDATWRPAEHKRSDARSIHQPSTTSKKPAAAASGGAGHTPSPPVSYFDSDTFFASPPPPESLTKPAYNRYRATIDIERSTVKGWEDVIPSAGDPDWSPPPVDFWTLAAHPVPWLRFKVLPPQLTFVIAELWEKVVLPLYELVRRSWVVSVAPAVDRRAFGGKREDASTGDEDDASSSPSSSSSAASSLSVLEIALLRWHGKRTPLDDVAEWVRALLGKK